MSLVLPRNDLRRVILVVDDEPDLREILRIEFEENGYSVCEAAGGHDALAAVESRTIDLVITDMRMPKGSGAELLQQLKLRFPHIPVIVFMAVVDETGLEWVRQQGARAIVSKPFDVVELVAIVQDCLR